MSASFDAPVLRAVLGPTNTGKTHFALERMLAHQSGMIGFPLRLLARENYDRVVAQKGRAAAALITGEEKILPPNPRWYLCTVESMPLERSVAFLAVDEVQLAADPERGHVFTDRLLRARGTAETLFIGAETARPIIRRLVPDARFDTRPRLSKLSYAGPRKLHRLPPRSAVIGFSAAEVYSLAEGMRRQRGGAAVVLGALSPRTRNAQVAMFQAGEVDHIVATDAIGMGLNMDINHVAFASLTKFDGRGHRCLAPAEVAQIAGRAGRHMNDGSFGVTAGLEPLEQELVDAIENHSFEPLRHVFWRNPALDYSSPRALLNSLGAPPPHRVLARACQADDHAALAALSEMETVKRLARGPAAVRLLWDVAQVPDFRKLMSDSHVRLLAAIYGQLMSDGARLPDDWVAAHVARLDRVDGDIETLMGRIAGIRIWTYVSHRGEWLSDGKHWQERTRSIEDRLSDALHDRLTQRFVDRRAAAVARRLAHGGTAFGLVDRDGTVSVDGQEVGRLVGFRFAVDGAAAREDAKAIWQVARRTLAGEINGRLRRLAADGDRAFELAADGRILWRGVAVARLVPGDHALEPGVAVLDSDLLDPPDRAYIAKRLTAWLQATTEERLGALVRALSADTAGPVRGIVYQLGEGLGSVPRRRVAALIADLSAAERKRLAKLGVRLGSESVFLSSIASPRATAWRAALWAAHAGERAPDLAANGPWLPADDDVPRAYYAAIGYRVVGEIAVRVDALERLAAAARRLARQGPFQATPALARTVGCAPAALPAVLATLGYDAREENGATMFVRRRRRKSRNGRRNGAPGSKKRGGRTAATSPFADLAELVQRD